jgi:hypothetical protein
MTNLFEPSLWSGEFFLPDMFHARFPGTLSYSLEDGVVLTYRIGDDTKLPEAQALHGILDTGDMCTLFGKFTTLHSGFTVRNGLHTTNGKHGFRMLAVGGFLDPKIEIDDLQFSPSGLQVFLLPGGHGRFGKYSDKPIETIDLPSGQLEIRTNGNFHLVAGDITTDLYCRDEFALAALSAAYRDVTSRFPDAFFMLKRDLEYVFRLRTTKPVPLVSSFAFVADVCNFFALLLSRPTYPQTFSALLKVEDDTPTSIALYPSLGLSAATIRLIKKQEAAAQLPVISSDLAFAPVLQNWMSDPNRHSVLISAIQHEVGFRTEHTAHGDLVLYSSQLESIAHDAGHKKDKYEYPIVKFGTATLRSILESSLGVSGSADVGTAIGDLRNEIAHVGRPKVRLAKMTLAELMRVSTCLRLVVASYALQSIAVPDHAIGRYLDKLAPRR